MTYGRTLKKSKETSNNKSSSVLAEYSNCVLIEEDFSNQNINHTILKSSKIIRSNFNKASLTGSIFNECEFIDCLMNVPDLEYCKFYDCKFRSNTRRRFVASINNSTFIRTHFTKATFYGCSFAESYFEECRFDMTKLEYSALENAVYRFCEFIGMNFNNSNLQFSEWEGNTFSKCIMSINQPAYMIGGLEICTTKDSGVQFISSDESMYSSKEYIDRILPSLLTEYSDREEYFPVANIYIFQKNYVEAMRILKKGVIQAISYRDFRMLKFYCKLIVHAKVFDSHTLYDFYHCICRLLPQGQNSNAEMHFYMRNIGEIKSILFQSSKRPSLHMSFITNIFSKNADKVGSTIERLFRIAKMNGLNQCEILLSENSPLIIDINIHGAEENIQLLLTTLVSLTTTELSYTYNLVPPSEEMKDEIAEFQEQCKQLNISLTLAEYYLENCQFILQSTKIPYFYNGSIRRERDWQNLLESIG